LDAKQKKITILKEKMMRYEREKDRIHRGRIKAIERKRYGRWKCFIRIGELL